MVTKTIKVYFNKPLNVEYTELTQRLRDLRYETCRIMNYGMTQFWLWEKKRQDIKKETGKLPTIKELPQPGNDKSQPIKKFINQEFPNFPSYCTATVTQSLKKKWGSDCKDVFFMHRKSLSTYKLNVPILCGNTQYKLEKRTNFGHVLTVTLANKQHKGTKRFEIQLNTKRMNKSQKIILDRIVSKEYKAGELKIIEDKKKKQWYIATSFSFEPSKPALDPNINCGLDMGIAEPFYCALSNSPARLRSGDGGQIEHIRKQITKRRKQMFNQYSASTRKGQGRKHALKPTDKLRNKIDNFRDTKQHTHTKMIIDFCLKHNAGVIQMEDLSSLTKHKQDNMFLKDWALHSFQEKLDYKAKEAGIEIIKINPQYTSQRCSKCGCISPDNRKTQADFRCITCGHKANADYNAACNLAMPDIENAVKEVLAIS